MGRHNLGELEQLVLLALMRVGDEGYGARIRQELLERCGRSVTPGAIYPTLDRLESRGLVTSAWGEPSSVRGGRARRHFTITAAGLEEIRRAWAQTEALARGLRAALSPKGK